METFARRAVVLACVVLLLAIPVSALDVIWVDNYDFCLSWPGISSWGSGRVFQAVIEAEFPGLNFICQTDMPSAAQLENACFVASVYNPLWTTQNITDLQGRAASGNFRLAVVGDHHPVSWGFCEDCN